MNKRYNGGILLTTLLLAFLFSFIFILILEDFQLTQAFTKKTKDYYIAKIMVSMFLSDRKQEQKSFEKKGEQRYSTGVLQYEYNETIVWFTIEVNQATYKFKEEYRKSKKADRLVKDEVK